MGICGSNLRSNRISSTDSFERESFQQDYNQALQRALTRSRTLAESRQGRTPDVTIAPNTPANRGSIRRAEIRGRPSTPRPGGRQDVRGRREPIPSAVIHSSERGRNFLLPAAVSSREKERHGDLSRESAMAMWGVHEMLDNPDSWNARPNAHKGGIVTKRTGTLYELKRGEMIVPTSRVSAVKKAMQKAKLKPIKNKI